MAIASSVAVWVCNASNEKVCPEGKLDNFDVTPLLILAATGFVMLRFFAVGTDSKLLYVIAGMCGALLIGLTQWNLSPGGCGTTISPQHQYSWGDGLYV